MNGPATTATARRLTRFFADESQRYASVLKELDLLRA